VKFCDNILFRRISASISYLARGNMMHSIGASFGSKMVTMVTTWLLMPLLAVKLGPEIYGIYILYLSMLTVLNLADSGVGSAIVRLVAKGEGGYRVNYLKLMLECMRFYAPVAFLLIISVFTILWSSHCEMLLGLWGIYVSIALVVVGFQVVLMPIARIYLGAGLIAAWSKLAILTNLLFLLVILISLNLTSDLSLSVLLIGHALTSLSLPLFALFRLMSKTRRQKIEVGDHYSCADVRSGLLRESASQVPILVCGIMQREFPKWGLLVVFPAAALGRLGLLLSALGAIGGLVGMFANIIWPKISSGIHRGDTAGARESKNFLYMVFLAFSIVLWGSIVFLFWGRDGVFFKGYGYDIKTIVVFGFFSMVVIWEYIHYCILMALDQLKLVAGVSVCQAISALLMWWFLPINDELIRYFTAQIIAYGCCSALVFPITVNKKI
jgi:O-antigen/teichoic acid export membrane protein